MTLLPSLRHVSITLLCTIALGGLHAHAQTSTTSVTAPAPDQSKMDGELFYQLLLGELNARGGEPGTGFSLMLDAARKTNDAQLYERAVDIAIVPVGRSCATSLPRMGASAAQICSGERALVPSAGCPEPSTRKC
jgi:hypothetical protein